MTTTLQTYVYSQHMAGRYGAGVIAKHFRFEPGRFYRLRYEVAVNNPAAKSNGYMRLLINGEPVVEQRNIKFRTTDFIGFADQHLDVQYLPRRPHRRLGAAQ